MARKSGWQEFAENFKSSYKMVNDVKSQYATNQIMEDKIEENEAGKYTYMDKEYGTENEALSQQYSRLADNATRFGDTDKGLGYRKQITDIESNRIQADIARATKQDQIALQGQLAVLMQQANIGNKNADTARLGSVTGLNNQSLSENKRTFDTRLRSLVAKAGLDEANTTISEVKAAIAKGTQTEEQTALLAEIEKRRIVAEADGANFETVSDLNIDQQRAALADTKQGTKVKKETVGQIGADTKRTEALTAKQVFENTRQEAFKIADYAAYGESLDADLEAAKARGDQSALAALTAQRGELRETALMDFHTFVPETDEATYGTADDQRYDQWLGMIKTFDGPEAALKWQNSHNAETTGLILADSSRLKAEVDSAFLPGGGGLNKVATMMDEINGPGTGVKVIRDSDGVKLVETNEDGSAYRVVAAGKTEVEVQKIVQTMAGPEGAIKVADVLHQTKTRKLDLDKAEQEIETAKVGQALRAAQGRLATAQIKSVDFDNKLTEQQTKQISEKITDIIADRGGIGVKDKQTLVIKELAKFLTFNFDASDDEISAFVSQLGDASNQVSNEFADFENVTAQ